MIYRHGRSSASPAADGLGGLRGAPLPGAQSSAISVYIAVDGNEGRLAELSVDRSAVNTGFVQPLLQGAAELLAPGLRALRHLLQRKRVAASECLHHLTGGLLGVLAYAATSLQHPGQIVHRH